MNTEQSIPLSFHFMLWLSFIAMAGSFAYALLVTAYAKRSARRVLFPFAAFAFSSFGIALYQAILVYYSLNISPDLSLFTRRFWFLGALGDAAVATRAFSFIAVLASLSGKPWFIRCSRFIGTGIIMTYAIEFLYHSTLILKCGQSVVSRAWGAHMIAESIILAVYALSAYGFAITKKKRDEPVAREMRAVCALHLVFAVFFVLAQIDYVISAGAYFANAQILFSALLVIQAGGGISRMLKRMPAMSADELPQSYRSPAGFSGRWQLSPRESDILSGLVEHKKPARIAEELFISIRTVNTHIQSIYRKCGVTSRIALMEVLRKEIE